MKSKIQFPTKSGVILLKAKSIVCCTIDGRNSKLLLANQNEVEVMVNLKDLANRLPKELFFRCHAKFLINLEYIKGYNLKIRQIDIDGSTQTIPLAKDRCHEFKLWLEKNIGKKI